jgi:enoyl-CoA hydratase/carnithine racemase
LTELRQCSPAALAACKQLLFESINKPLDDTVQYRAHVLNSLRQSEEGQEGLTAFVQKRPPKWARTE